MSEKKKRALTEREAQHPMKPGQGPEYPPESGSPMVRHWPPSESGAGVAAPYVPENRARLTEPTELSKFRKDHAEGPGSSNPPTPQNATQQNTAEHAIENTGVSTDRTLFRVRKKNPDEVQVV
jgi:hypothetical protein